MIFKTLNLQDMGAKLARYGGKLARNASPHTGADLCEVLTLRTLDDALRLAPRLGVGRRLLVIGGGFVGLEVAASARRLGTEVTLVEGASRLLGRAVPAETAAQVLALHLRHGVDIRLGVLPTAITKSHPGEVQVELHDGTSVHADTVVVGIGMQPAVDLARAAGLAVGQGITVDAHLQTSDPDVFAAGDVAEFPSPLSGRPMRQETWHNAETQARVAALNMVGSCATYDHAAWFWSDQYDHQLQVCGEPALGTHTAVRELAECGRITFHLDTRHRVVGTSACGVSARCLKEFRLARLLVDRRASVGIAELADPSVPLKALASTATVGA